MKNKYRISIKIVGLIGIIIIIAGMINHKLKSVSSIGIIGAADGPTSIFIVYEKSNMLFYGLAAVLLVILLLTVYTFRKKK